MMCLALGVFCSTTNNHNSGHTAGCGVCLGGALMLRALEVQWPAGSNVAAFLALLRYFSVCFSLIYLPLQRSHILFGLSGSKAAIGMRSTGGILQAWARTRPCLRNVYPMCVRFCYG